MNVSYKSGGCHSQESPTLQVIEIYEIDGHSDRHLLSTFLGSRDRRVLGLCCPGRLTW